MILMRFVDVMYAFPRLLFVIMIMSMLGRGLLNIFIAIGLTGWVRVARLTRAQMLSLKEREFCEAARAAAARNLAIIVRHLLPNALTPIIISLTFGIPEAIFTEAALSFIGVGISPPPRVGDRWWGKSAVYPVVLASLRLPGRGDCHHHARIYAFWAMGCGTLGPETQRVKERAAGCRSITQQVALLAERLPLSA